MVIEIYPPDDAKQPSPAKIQNTDTNCAYPSLITLYPVPPNVTIVNAFATIDLPWFGKDAEPSSSNPGNGQLGCLTFAPSTRAPLPPKNEITEEF